MWLLADSSIWLHSAAVLAHQCDLIHCTNSPTHLSIVSAVGLVVDYLLTHQCNSLPTHLCDSLWTQYFDYLLTHQCDSADSPTESVLTYCGAAVLLGLGTTRVAWGVERGVTICISRLREESAEVLGSYSCANSSKALARTLKCCSLSIWKSCIVKPRLQAQLQGIKLYKKIKKRY